LERTTKKLKHKIEYLRLELEEILETNSRCLEKFNQDFAGDFPDDETLKDRLENDKESEKPFEVPKQLTTKLFKEIAIKTHPDKRKTENDDVFVEANKANRKNDLSTLLSIAEDLNIDVNEFVDNSLLLEKHAQEMIDKIRNIKNQMAWVWYHVDDIRRPLVRKRIQQMLTIDKE
tara:strand:- start:110 stop:634 length:525 start_codon:yes stop_codon:yes gene_type:complete